ncbi:uncharacterized protein LOC18774026 [Prunus persica]|uniref:uncharacterized protein LOC18774026 n=1 Tax=Prunus persica TaxID=3760 RepID=UPI0009AB9270|nr:uncharacterized protein LOC18774026 [Prunus persica]XP_020423055.1 uncharacterized protein LOC18774026 [Prunus persica]
MADKSMDNIELKVLVNNVSNKVIFVESDGDFIDVLFSFLTIPMGTVIRLSHRSQPLGIGCMDNIYGSVESFDSQLFRTEECRAMLLRPRNRTEYLLDNLKLKFDDSEPMRYFMCSNPHCRIFRNSLVFSYYQKVRCPRCERLMDTETTLPVSGAEDGEVFVKGPARFIISDDLQVMHPFTSTSSYLVKNLGCTGWNSIEELTVNVGVDEVLKLLMCSLVSKMPLTETLLKHEPLPELSNENVDQEIYVESRMLGDATNEEEEKISIKLIVSKSRKMVCYAEAGEEFVNLLFSFLTLPLGFIVKQMQDNSMKGCIDQLYKSVQDLDEQCLKSNNHKKMLVSPKLLPGFGYKNHPLGIEEASYRLAVDTTLIHSNKQVKSVEFIDPKSHRNKDDNALGFLKGPAMFMITDSLNVSPISAILGLSILCELNVPVTDIEVQVAQVGKKEALCLLVASFVCDSALTSVFLRKPNRGFGCLSFLI